MPWLGRVEQFSYRIPADGDIVALFLKGTINGKFKWLICNRSTLHGIKLKFITLIRFLVEK